MDDLEGDGVEAQPGPEPWPWEDEASSERSGTSRRWMLLAVAVVPWVAVIGLVLAGTPVRTEAPAGPSPVEPAPASMATAPVAPTPDPASDTSSASVAGARSGRADAPGAVQVTSAARHTPDLGDAVTVAVLVARGWFQGPGPRFRGSGNGNQQGPTGYLEHVWVEAVDAPWRGHVVVTLGVLVLGVDSASDALVAEPRRLAVPVSLDASGARPAGSPYALPDPTLVAATLELDPVDDPDRTLAAVDALADAGYRDAELVALHRTQDGWPWIASVQVATAGDGPRRVDVWLRPHLDGFVVAGWLPPRPAPASPSEPRSDDQEVAR